MLCYLPCFFRFFLLEHRYGISFSLYLCDSLGYQICIFLFRFAYSRSLIFVIRNTSSLSSRSHFVSQHTMHALFIIPQSRFLHILYSRVGVGSRATTLGNFRLLVRPRNPAHKNMEEKSSASFIISALQFNSVQRCGESRFQRYDSNAVSLPCGSVLHIDKILYETDSHIFSELRLLNR